MSLSISIFPNNFLIDIDTDIDIFKNGLIDIDIFRGPKVLGASGPQPWEL